MSAVSSGEYTHLTSADAAGVCTTRAVDGGGTGADTTGSTDFSGGRGGCASSLETRTAVRSIAPSGRLGIMLDVATAGVANAGGGGNARATETRLPDEVRTGASGASCGGAGIGRD